ncbi:carboxypeptidase-like regulatory domain-containing protein [bacterium SCSIO 12741]|nr:carboxypeptidase-like regulatory domain-containing protein [bacterium SCSIO 12741]
MKKILLIVFVGLLAFSGSAQIKDSLIQFSGVFLDADSLTPVPFVNIAVVNRHRGTSTDYRGTFSFVANRGDTVRFTCIGYRPFQCIIPDTLTTQRYTLVQLFSRDTFNLPEAVIFPWPSKEEFREAFLNLNIPDDDLERARKNLEREERRAQMEGYDTWGSINYKLSNQAYTERLYYAGQSPPISVFNPFAWAEFFQALKNGDLKDPRKKEKDD